MVAMREIVVTGGIAAPVPTVHRPRCASPSGGVVAGAGGIIVTAGGPRRSGVVAVAVA
jgi:hypothetical protein